MKKNNRIISIAIIALAIFFIVMIYRDRIGDNRESPPVQVPQITIIQPEVWHLAGTPYDMSSNTEVTALYNYQMIFDAPKDYDPSVAGDYEMTVILDNNNGNVFTYSYILHVREPILEVVKEEVSIRVNQEYDLWSNVNVTSYDGTKAEPHQMATYDQPGDHEVTLEFEKVTVTYKLKVTQ